MRTARPGWGNHPPSSSVSRDLASAWWYSETMQVESRGLGAACGWSPRWLVAVPLRRWQQRCGRGWRGWDGGCSVCEERVEMIVLDITYFEENQLVDEDFPEDSSLQRVKELISILSEPEVLVKESNMHQDLLDVLGAELLECLFWRRGALLYMYCHTVKERRQWLTENIDLFKKCLNDGIHYLLKMLRFRCPTPLNDVSFQNTDTATLLSEGIFSDTHLLAMMYCGEMCYWGLKYCGEEKPGCYEIDSESNTELYCSSHSVVLDFREVGEKMLIKYVAVCEGPLKGQDWNTANAKLILDYFKKFHN
uniref:Chromosome 5 open reading frame 51 n=1 Tax=Pelusios castaneus TaxID=367368 RepID=A0A8C8RAG0_9SAUR